MQTATHAPAAPVGSPVASSTTLAGPQTSAYANYQIIRRNGAVVPFEPGKIAVAML